MREGDVIPVDYDPMLAKLIVWDKDREAAIRRLRAALAETRVAGIAANVTFLRTIVALKAFAGGALDTGFIERHDGSLLSPVRPAANETLAMAVIGLLCARALAALEEAKHSADPWNPWHSQNGWRLNELAREILRLREIRPDGSRDHNVEIVYLPDGWRFGLAEGIFFYASGTLAPDGALTACLDGHRLNGVYVRSGDEISLIRRGEAGHRFVLASATASTARGGPSPERLTAPMPGRIAALLVEFGSRVEVNQPVLVLEAMKMEHLLTAPRSGIVKEVKFKLGSQVAEGVELVTFETGPPPKAAS